MIALSHGSCNWPLPGASFLLNASRALTGCGWTNPTSCSIVTYVGEIFKHTLPNIGLEESVSFALPNHPLQNYPLAKYRKMRATALLVAVEYIVDFPSHVTGHEQEVSYGTCDTPITYREHSGSPIAVDGREKSETDQLPWTIEEFAVSRRFTQKNPHR